MTLGKIYIGAWPVRHKVMLILAVIVLPVVVMMMLYITTVRQLLEVQEEVDRLFAVQFQTHAILAHIVDMQDGFRGFVLTRNEDFLAPYYAAEEAFDPAIFRLKEMVRHDPEQLTRVTDIEEKVRTLLQKKRRLIDDTRFGEMKPVREHIESGAGQRYLAEIRVEIAAFENAEKTIMQSRQKRATRLAMLTRYGLGGVMIGVLVLWWLATRLLSRTITGPLATLTVETMKFGQRKMSNPIPISSNDELGLLARTMEQMAERIQKHMRQMEALHAIAKDISTIGPDGLEGVLRRIAERAAEILNVELCLVLLWEETISCWKVGAASGVWHELLRRSVLIREETPIAIRALTTALPQVVEDLTAIPEPVSQIRDRFGAKSLLAVPLAGESGTFGVLALAPITERRSFTEWDIHLAQQFADQASIAILNARLYEAASQRGEGLQIRLENLERYAADMAHDLKGPARRMAELASLLQMDYKGQLDERGDRYLAWIRDNGQQLMTRIEEVLKLARIGTVHEIVEAVDPSDVVQEVLKGCTEQIQRQGARVRVAERFPRLACNRVHLFQVMDNLVRNALTFSGDTKTELEIGVIDHESGVLFVRDNGIGIAPEDQGRLFKPFERLGQIDRPGTGIGLTIVKKIIELYQGKIWVESEVGRGTIFFFSLPLYGQLASVENAGAEVRDQL